jgi:UDP-2,3-diacylglucosamine pyrophosphatase LpxH
MKDFKKMHKDSEWVALVNYQLSDAEKQLIDKDEKTDEELILLGDIYKKFEKNPSAEEKQLLNKVYDSLLDRNDIGKDDVNLQGAHVTIENDKLRGVLNLIDSNGFKQLTF